MTRTGSVECAVGVHREMVTIVWTEGEVVREFQAERGAFARLAMLDW